MTSCSPASWRSPLCARICCGPRGGWSPATGKTVVALLASAAVIEGGRQAALMAPTEILARQHFNTITPLAAAAGIKVAILIGRERGRARGRTGGAFHVLVMTATPIPRTLVLTYFGDMDVSELREKPAGRQPID